MTPTQPIKGLYAIIDPQTRLDLTPAGLARACLEGGARILQLRQKDTPAPKIIENAKRILDLKARHDFVFIVNDHPEIAAKVGADGVHVGQGDMSVANARSILGSDKIIGKSTHSLAQAEDALREPIDYLAFGAIYPTDSKPKGHPVLGIGLLRQVIGKSRMPVVAIGGISRGNAAEVVKTGVAAIALISALAQSGDPAGEARYFSGLFTSKVN